jgi:putative MFS transporter
MAEADAVVSGIKTRVFQENGMDLPAPNLNVPDAQTDEGRWQEMLDSFYLQRTATISFFPFAQTIAVFGFMAFDLVVLMKHGFTIVHSPDDTLMIVLLALVGAAAAHIFPSE